MFSIDVYDLYWLSGPQEETDLCAHGSIRIRIGDAVLEDNGLSVSAAGLHLLRSLTEDHEPDDYAKLFPLDGFSWTPDGDSIYLGGCPNAGFDGYVTHEDDMVCITLEGLPPQRIPLAEYRMQVLTFVDQVAAFFRQSKPKVVTDELDKLWYPRFWDEWRLRRAAAENP